MSHIFERVVGERVLTIEYDKLARQANGAVTIRYGDTVVLVTACASPKPREETDFFPLTIDYEERLYAAGKIPGGFFRREGRPSQEATLAARLTDRPLRPLFPPQFRNEVHIVTTVLSADQENDPAILSIIGASAALSISDIPFYGPVAATAVGYINDEFVINPTFTQRMNSQLDLVVAGTSEAVMMVEAGAKEAPEHLVAEAIKLGQEANQEVIALQRELVQAFGKPKISFEVPEVSPETEAAISEILGDRLEEAFRRGDGLEVDKAVHALEEELLQRLGETYPQEDILSIYESKLKAKMRASILDRGIRPDGRRPAEIRPITCEVGTLPRTHGSGLFTRGETQVLTIATLGSVREEQMIDGLTQEESRRFMHHYNFPPFSTGEVGRIGGPRRREIGHGALAERALAPVIPSDKDFPYTIRLVSEVLSSNGSTSMASVCGSSLSLMDAGVPIKAPVAGVAIGLVVDGDKHAILTDIGGIEDHLGDMDFKVAATAQGITALQMDTKLKGISHGIMVDALHQAMEACLFILERMRETISDSRPELSQYAPRMVKININPDKIGTVIGPGGKTIRSMIDEYKVTIDIEDDGSVIIGAHSEEAAQKAIKHIESLIREAEVGVIYTGKVKRVTNFGAFVEIMPGKEGLVHISELADYRVASVEDVVKVGDEITVMVTDIDRMGRINLSRRAVLERSAAPAEGGPSRPQPPSPEYPFRTQRPARPDSRFGGQRGEPRPPQSRPAPIRKPPEV